MVPGRQKAIRVGVFQIQYRSLDLLVLMNQLKWGRARAIWEAYCNTPTPAQPSESSMSGPLDVYRWLEQEGHFPKQQPVSNSKIMSAKGKEKATQETPELYCAVCGYVSLLHPQTTTDDGQVKPVFCKLPEWMHRPPLLDVHSLRTCNPIWKVPPRPTKSKLKGATSRIILSNRELTTAEEPVLTLAVNRVASSLQLPCLKSSKGTSEDLHDAGALYDALGPSALLALATRVLIRRLVDAGIRTMESQPPPSSALLNSTSGSSRKDRNSRHMKKRVLTPAHIMQGICDRVPGVVSTPAYPSSTPTRYDGPDAILVAIGRLGTTVGLENLLQSRTVT